MGIETILVVIGLVIVLAVVVATMKSKRKVEAHTQPPKPPRSEERRP
ncbi:MAG TPA: hypothetical protein VGD81_08590 [Opitutaceae bacterium]